jgi:hypothetical protein
LARRIIIDGIRIEGAEAKRIVNEVLRDADATGKPRRRMPLAMLGGATLSAAVVSGITGAGLPRLAAGLSRFWITVICAVLAAIVSAIWVNIYLRLHRRQFREAMRRRGFELCLGCGYWLKGLSDDITHCPECGRDRESRAEMDIAET